MTDHLAVLEKKLASSVALAEADPDLAPHLQPEIDAYSAAIALMRGQSDMVEFVAAVKSVRSSLARNRQFGDDTFGSWRRAACSAEGDLEEAIAALPAPPKDTADEQ